MEQNRFRSKYAWGVMIASVIAILGVFLSKDTVSTIEIILGAVFVAVEAFGVFQNPTDKLKF